MLTLPIKKKWFDMILNGVKLEEYREIKPYYDSRLLTMFGAIMVGDELLQGEAVPEEIRRAAVQPVIFRNGYGRNCPEFLANCTLAVKEGRPEWGAEPGVKYYTLQITLEDRRTGETENGFIIVPYPGEHPDDLADVHPVIKNHYDRLGYNVQEIKHQESKVTELDLKEAYDAAPTTAAYAE